MHSKKCFVVLWNKIVPFGNISFTPNIFYSFKPRSTERSTFECRFYLQLQLWLSAVLEELTTGDQWLFETKQAYSDVFVDCCLKCNPPVLLCRWQQACITQTEELYVFGQIKARPKPWNDCILINVLSLNLIPNSGMRVRRSPYFCTVSINHLDVHMVVLCTL